MNYDLLQKHTVDLYHLKDKDCQLRVVKARTLLALERFDLFAKLFYIRNRETNPQLATKVYAEHIKAFNPDGKEPGREDKNSVADFIAAFDLLIDTFRAEEHDPSISVIPVSTEGVILDGAHRVAALAYYDKEVTIAQFADVHPVASFDYRYFATRGLPRKVADLMAFEVLSWADHIYVACLWPRIGGDAEKQRAIDCIAMRGKPFYAKKERVSLEALASLVAKVYKAQPWVGDASNHYAGANDKALNCYGKSKEVEFVFFQGGGLQDVLALKDEIRAMFTYEKHSIHITDNQAETQDIASLVLLEEGLSAWLLTGDYGGAVQRLARWLREEILIFKNVHWLQAKVAVYRILTLRFLRKE